MASRPAPPPRKPLNPIVSIGPGGQKTTNNSDWMITSNGRSELDSSKHGLSLVGASNLAGVGNNGDANTLTAASNTGNSTLVAGTAATTMIGGSGNNWMDATRAQGSVSLRGGLGSSTMLAANGPATLMGGGKNNSLVAGTSIDRTIGQSLVGGTSTSSLFGNTLRGGTGPDTLISGAGYSTLISGSSANGGNTLIGRGLSNSLSANYGNDSLVALRGNSTLLGGPGLTTLLGGAAGSNNWLESRSTGAFGNTLIGRAGNNTLVASSAGNDSIVGGANQNLLLVTQNNFNSIGSNSISLSTLRSAQNTLGISLPAVTLLGDSFFSGMATQGVSNLGAVRNLSRNSTRISLGKYAEQIGVSSLLSGTGSDTLSVGSSSNSFLLDGSQASSRVSIVGGLGNDTLMGSKLGGDTLIGGNGNDSILAHDPNVLPDISFEGRNVTPTARNYITSGTNSLINGLGGPSGYGSNVLFTNDDGSSGAIDITPIFADGLNFYGRQIKKIYINNNGNITFNSPASTFTPETIDAGGMPIIAPFWADVDTRGATGNVSPGGTSDGANRLFWNIDPTNRVMTITWDDVGYFARNSNKVNAFQLQLIDSGNGDAFIVFRYEAVNWTTGEASQGVNGLGGRVARAGFNTGTGTVIELPQSGNQAAMLGLPQTKPTVGLNSNSPGVFVFEVRNGKLSLDVAGDYLTGGAGSDTIIGWDGDDTLLGGTGTDNLAGGKGNDLYYVDNAVDIVLEKADEGRDTVVSTSSYSLSENVEILRYIGADSGTLVGNALANTIFGSAQGDRIDGGAGIDSLVGGKGDDTYVISDLGDIIFENAGDGTDLVESSINYTLAGNLEKLSLVGSAISGTGNALVNTITGNTFNNSIDGGIGADSLVGGVGNDSYFVDNLGDTVFEKPQEGTDVVFTSVSHRLNDNVENLTYTGTGNATLGGNSLGNVIDVRTSANPTVFGGAGNDTLIVNASRIGTVDGGGDMDTIRFVGGPATLSNLSLSAIEIYDLSQLTGQAAVTLGNNSSALQSLVGTAGNDTITVRSATNATLNAAEGNDRFVIAQASLIGAKSSIVGGSGADTLAFANTSRLADSIFGQVSSVEILEQNGTGNHAFLGSLAQTAGIRKAIMGMGNDTLDVSGFTTGITLDASRNTGASGYGSTVKGGSGDDLILFSNHNVFAISKVVGGAGSDTLAFSENGISITDAKFGKSPNSNLDQVEALRTKDGTNYIQAASLAASSGLESIISGAGKDTIDASAFNAASIMIDAGSENDVIFGSDSANNSINAGTGNDAITLKNAAAISRSTVDGGAGTDTLSLSSVTTLNDSQLGGLSGIEVLSAASFGDNKFILGANAQAADIRTVIGGDYNDTLDASGYTAGITFNGGTGNDSLIISTGDRLRASKIDGGYKTDTLSFSMDALSVTDADFVNVDNVEALKTANGNNRILLGANAQAAGITTLMGGAGRDTIDASGFTTRGLTFLNPDAVDSLIGGAAIDTISVSSSFNMSLSSGIEVLKLTGSSSSTLTGNNQNNTILGATGRDTLIGLGGNDAYIVNSNGDTIIDSSGIDAVYSSVSFDLSDSKVTEIENLIYTGSGDASLTGNSLNNSIKGGLGSDTINGGDGDDYISGEPNIPDSLGTITSYAAFDKTLVTNNELALGNAALASGSGILITDAKYTGNTKSVAFVTSDIYWGAIGGREVRQGQGIVLSTGNAITPSNNITTQKASNNMETAGSYLLADILKSTFSPTTQSKDAASLELTFEVTDPSAKYISMDVIFGSEEFPQYTNSFPDIAAIYIDDVNVAFLNNDPNAPLSALQKNVDSGYIIDNTSGELSTVYDGVIPSISFGGKLSRTTTGLHTIKLVIADTNDHVLDSAIYVSNIKAVATPPLVASSQNDSLMGGAGDDTILGYLGNDTIDGGVGADSMIGGVGNDIYFVDNEGDKVFEKAGEGTDIVFSTASHTLGANIEKLTYTGSGSATLVGNTLANTIIGNDQGNRIDGGTGIDSLVGGRGNDTYVVDSLADVIVEDALGGIDLVESSINYTLAGNLEQLYLVGSAISGTGNTLANTITGNTLNNSIDGGLGADSLVGGAGNDTYFIDNAGDSIFEKASEGTDIVFSTVSHTLGANVENLTYIGTSDASLIGNASANVIDGSAAGVNTLSGGAGNDTLIVNAARIGVVNGETEIDTIRVLGGSVTLNNAAFSNVELYDLSQLTGQAAVTLGNNASALQTLVGTAGNDTITVSSVTTNAILNGASGNDRFAFSQASLIGDNASIVGGVGTDTLSFTETSNLADSLFGRVSSLEILEQNGTGNSASLGTLAQAAGIRRAITGTGNDTLDASGFTTGITLDASRNTGSDSLGSTITGGSGDDMILLSNHNVLENSMVKGGAGSDTLSFGENGISITDSKFGSRSNINQVEALRTKDGTNYIQVATQAADSGINSIIGGTGKDTIDASGFDATSIVTTSIVIEAGGENDLIYGSNSANNTIDAGTGNDVIIITGGDLANNSIDAGTGNDAITLKNAAAISLSTVDGGAGTDTLSLYTATVLNDSQLGGLSSIEVLRASDGDSKFILGATSQQVVGIRSVFGGDGNDTLDVSAYTVGISLDGGAGDDSLVVSTGDMLRKMNVDGGAGRDTLSFSIDALSVTDADFLNVDHVEALKTANGNNRILLGANAQAAGIITLIGGTGRDTLDASATTRGFVFLNPGAVDSLIGGTGIDTISVSSSFNMSLSSGIEVLKLTGASPSTLTGNNQDNTIIGATGQDTLIGLGGNDAYIVNSTGDTIIDSSGTEAVYSSVSFDLSNTLVASGTGIENLVYTNSLQGGVLIGNTANNSITGNLGNDTLQGKNIADTLGDTLNGGIGGNDTYIVDSTYDTIIDSAGTADAVRSSVSFDLSNTLVAGGNGIENLVYTNSLQGGVLIGNTANNSITGNLGNDTITGKAGTDTLIGLGGDDIYIVDSTTDTIIDSAGTADAVRSSVSFDLSNTLVGGGNGIENLVYTGAGDATLTGNALNNSITGGSGKDTITGKGGTDTLIGEGDDDTYIVDSTDDTIIDFAGTADVVRSSASFDLSNTLVADGTGIENLVYTGLTAATLTGNALNNSITGNLGNDTLTGKAGTDTLIGLGGDDIYIVDSTTDTIIDSAGTADAVRSSVSFDLSNTLVGGGNGIENLVYTGAGDATLTGNALNNSITGGSGKDTITGKGGTDTLIGEGDDDTYIVDSTYDTIIDLAGTADLVRSSASFDLSNTMVASGTGIENLVYTNSLQGGVLIGNTANNSITGNLGNDTLEGKDVADTLGDTLNGGIGGNDTYIVDSTYDTIIDLAGTADAVYSSVSFDLSNTMVASGTGIENLVYTGAGDIILTGNSIDNSITGNNGGDTIYGLSGNDTLSGLYGRDFLYGGNGNDLLLGGFSADFLQGGDGDDTLKGSPLSGSGTDTLAGGNGADLFVLGDATDGNLYAYSITALITDFEVGIDKLQLKDYGSGASAYRTEQNTTLAGYWKLFDTHTGTDVLLANINYSASDAYTDIVRPANII
jgi:Ca2+-binding RTX toxin-like protein